MMTADGCWWLPRMMDQDLMQSLTISWRLPEPGARCIQMPDSSRFIQIPFCVMPCLAVCYKLTRGPCLRDRTCDPYTRLCQIWFWDCGQARCWRCCPRAGGMCIQSLERTLAERYTMFWCSSQRPLAQEDRCSETSELVPFASFPHSLCF